MPVRAGKELFVLRTLLRFRLLQANRPETTAWPSEPLSSDVHADPATLGAPIPGGWRGSSVAIAGRRGELLALVRRRLDTVLGSPCPRREHAVAALAAPPLPWAWGRSSSYDGGPGRAAL
jgi:hypothetical protein